MPAGFIVNEGLADQKRVVLGSGTGKSSRENDGDKDLHDVVGDHGHMELRHVGFEMPRAFVVFLETIGDSLAPLVSMFRENQSMWGEFHSMALLRPRHAHSARLTNFVKSARASASVAAADACPPDAIIIEEEERGRDRKIATREPTRHREIIEFGNWP